ncbi:TolC family protein [Lacisediminimonas sp.]|uniref:TolC family protein n=1 Tax=Lacisediminimonas sp. TaxID=3060582 RepID=UPI002721883E|nr:TolC family protein [Lacisediminimonas sp.]MDO8300121.1 TolC family protein [Lacisediminimonas sp.]
MNSIFLPRFARPARLVLLGFSLLLGAAQSHAQQAWTFAQLLQSATDSHPLMMGKRSAQEAARAEKSGAEWARYPTPSLEATSRNVNGSSGVARLEQPIYNGGRISASIDAAGSRLDAAGASIEETRVDLRLRVIAAMVEAVRQKARLQQADASVAEHRRLLDMIGRRVSREVSSAVDQSLAQARLYQAINDQSQIAQGYRVALTQLSQLAGRPVADVSTQGLTQAGTPSGIESARDLANNYSPVLQRLGFEEAAASSDIGVRRGALYPQLAFRLERALGGTSESRALVVLQAQPGAGLSAQSGVDAAVARREAVRQAREAALREIDERITLDWNELQAANQRLENALQARQMSGDVFASYTRQYVIGRKSWLDVLNAVRESTQADFAVEDARAQALGASLRLRAQTGTLAAQ